MQPLKLPRGSDKEPMAFVYQQAIKWEFIRAEYFRRRGNLKKAQDASALAHFYQKEYDALPEHSHLFKRDLSKVKNPEGFSNGQTDDIGASADHLELQYAQRDHQDATSGGDRRRRYIVDGVPLNIAELRRLAASITS